MQITKQEYRRFIFESDVSPNAKLAVFAILEYYNNKTAECYPSQQSIAADCGFCKNTASRAVQEAEKAGLFEVKKVRMKGNRFTVNTYTFPFVVPKFGTSSEPSNEPSNDLSIDPSNERAKFGNKPIEPIKPKEVKKNNTKKSDELRPKNVEDEVWEDFLEVRKSKKAPITETAMKGIKREADKLGWTMNEALKECGERGWQGLKADWIQRAGYSVRPSKQSIVNNKDFNEGIEGFNNGSF